MGYLNEQPQDDYLLQAAAARGTSAVPTASPWQGTGEALAQGAAGAATSISHAIESTVTTAGAPAYASLGTTAAITDPDLVSPEMGDTTATHLNPQAAQDIIDTSAFGEQRAEIEKWEQQDKDYQGRNAQMAGDLLKNLGIFGVGTAAGGPVGAAALMGGTSADETYRGMKEQSVDDATAEEAAIGQGVVGAAGALVPFKLGSIPAKILGSAGINVGLGVAGRAANYEVLKANGYDDMADMQKPLDTQQMLAEVIIGAGMGVGAHFHETFFGNREPLPVVDRPPPSQVDAARVVANDARAADLAPGIPTSPDVGELHMQLLERFKQDIAEGREPSVTAEEAAALNGGIIENPAHVQAAQRLYEWARSYPEVMDALDMAPKLDEARAAVDQRFTESAAQRVQGAEGETAPIPLHDGVNEANLQHLEANYGDELIPQEDGSTKTVKQIAAEMRNEAANAESDLRLMDAAVACFARNGASL